jgi:hypothetical protein
MLILDKRRTDLRDSVYASPYWISSALIEGAAGSAVDITYAAGTIAGVSGSPDTITDSANQFVAEGFLDGDIIYVSGFSGAGAAANLDFFELSGPLVPGVAVGTLTVGGTSLLSDAAGETITIVVPKANVLFSFPGEGKYVIVHEIVVQIEEAFTTGTKITVGTGTIPLEISADGGVFSVVDMDGLLPNTVITPATPGFYGPTSGAFFAAQAARTWSTSRVIVCKDAGVPAIFCSIGNAAAVVAGKMRVHALITRLP